MYSSTFPKMEEKICDTPITGNYVAKHLKESLGPHAVLRSIDATKIALGQGYLSNILQLKLTWEESKGNDLPKTVIAKVPSVESSRKLMETLLSVSDEMLKMQAMMGQVVTMIHKAECDLYEMFGKNPPVAMPKFYVALPVTDEAPGMILMEDLSETASVGSSLVEGVTLGQAMAAVTEVAHLHAWSLTTSVDWRSKMPNVQDREQMMRGMLGPMAAGFKATKEKYPVEFGDIDAEKLTSLTNYETFYETMTEHRDVMKDVLIHGDFYRNNIMFEKNKDGTVGDKLVALIDFQNVMQASPTYDISRLFSLSISPAMRQKHGDEIIRRYYDEVKSKAGDKFAATFEQVKAWNDRQFALAAFIMVAGIQMVTQFMIKSEGEQKVKDEKIVLEKIKMNYEDALKILGLK